MAWFALKVFYNKVFEIEEVLKEQVFETYVPVRIEEHTKAGGKVLVRKPLIRSLMFINCSDEDIVGLQWKLEGQAMVYHYADSRTPIPIDDHEMQVFMLVTRAAENGLDFFDADASNFNQGQLVRVTGGQFKGAEGYIKRIKGNRRLVVAIEGIVAVVTTYIPSCFLEKVKA